MNNHTKAMGNCITYKRGSFLNKKIYSTKKKVLYIDNIRLFRFVNDLKNVWHRFLYYRVFNVKSAALVFNLWIWILNVYQSFIFLYLKIKTAGACIFACPTDYIKHTVFLFHRKSNYKKTAELKRLLPRNIVFLPRNIVFRRRI